MVPVIWAFFSADVNAGTASAARIAIIAITTSNSISVNAERNLFILIFIFGFFLRVFVLRGFGFFLRLVPRAAPAVVPRLRDEGRFGLESGGAYRRVPRSSQQLFLLFLGAQSFARFGGKGGSAR